MSTAFLPMSSAESLTEFKLVRVEIEDEVEVGDSTLAIPIVTEAAGTLVLVFLLLLDLTRNHCCFRVNMMP